MSSVHLSVNTMADGKKQVVVSVCGDMVGPVVARVQKIISEVIEYTAGHITLDMQAVKYIDSCGIGGLIYINTLLKRSQKYLFLSNLTDKVRSILQANNLDKVIRIAAVTQDDGNSATEHSGVILPS